MARQYLATSVQISTKTGLAPEGGYRQEIANMDEINKHMTEHAQAGWELVNGGPALFYAYQDGSVAVWAMSWRKG